MISKAAGDTLAPFLERRAHLESSLGERANAANASKPILQETLEMRRELDESERHQGRALDQRMRHIEYAGRQEMVKDEDRVRHLAHHESSKIEHLFRSGNRI